MARKPPKVPVSDFQELAEFCHAKGWRTELHVKDGLWTLILIDGRKSVAKESLRGEPPRVLDELALDAALTLVKSGRLAA